MAPPPSPRIGPEMPPPVVRGVRRSWCRARAVPVSVSVSVSVYGAAGSLGAGYTVRASHEYRAGEVPVEVVKSRVKWAWSA